MEIKKELDCIKKTYPKDFDLCLNFVNNNQYESVLEILNSIIVLDEKKKLMNNNEMDKLIDLTMLLSAMIPDNDIVLNDMLYENIFIDDEPNNDEQYDD